MPQSYRLVSVVNHIGASSFVGECHRSKNSELYIYLHVGKPCIEYMGIFTPSLFFPLSSHQEANFTSFFLLLLIRKESILYCSF